jgi:hypothetical protein
MPGDWGMPPYGANTSASGHDPSRIASFTAAAQAVGSGSGESITAFVMNHPTASCQISS